MDDDPLLKFISPIAGVVLAVVISIVAAAAVAGQIGDDYATRAWVYIGAVLWVLVGAVVMFVLAHRGESQPLSVRRVAMWTLSIWLWPVFAARLVQPREPPDIR